MRWQNRDFESAQQIQLYIKGKKSSSLSSPVEFQNYTYIRQFFQLGQVIASYTISYTFQMKKLYEPQSQQCATKKYTSRRKTRKISFNHKKLTIRKTTEKKKETIAFRVKMRVKNKSSTPPTNFLIGYSGSSSQNNLHLNKLYLLTLKIFLSKSEILTYTYLFTCYNIHPT